VEREYLLATASIDLTGKLWKVGCADMVMADEDDEPRQEQQWTFQQVHHLTGHEARLCKTAFHPAGKHVATTSFDHTWRLWDVATGQESLLQDGHAAPVYGVAFHPDGGLCATTDFAGVCHAWDLRTGKTVRHLVSVHAGRVLQTAFHPVSGFQWTTAGDDGTVKVWDLRRSAGRQAVLSVPAHSRLITGLKFDETGEVLASSSFDSTVKLWNTRNWKLLNELQGHDGKVAAVDFASYNAIVTCGFDKTLKLWR
jgi:U4/U6 small nuclear ribonucleoprotein PRP4